MSYLGKRCPHDAYIDQMKFWLGTVLSELFSVYLKTTE